MAFFLSSPSSGSIPSVEAYRHVPVINAQRLTSEAHMSDPPWREARPSRPYGGEPGARPRGRDPGIPPGAPRRRRPGPGRRRDPGRAGGRGDSRGSDPRGRDAGWGGRDSGPRGTGGNGWDPGRPAAGRGGDPDPARRPAGCPPQGSRGRAPPRGDRGMGPPGKKPTGVPGDRPPGPTQPRGPRDGEARGTGGDRAIPADARSSPPPPRGRRRWGTLQGGIGVCIIVASAAIGAIATMVTRSAPGRLLGLCVVVGAVTASLAVRPKAGLLIFPVPILSYLVAALISGVVFDRPYSSNTARAPRRGAVDRQRLLRDGARHRAGRRDHHRPLVSLAPRQARHARAGAGRARSAGRPRTGPGRTGPAGTGTVQAGAGRDGAPRPPRAAWETSSGIRIPRGLRGSG